MEKRERNSRSWPLREPFLQTGVSIRPFFLHDGRRSLAGGGPQERGYTFGEGIRCRLFRLHLHKTFSRIRIDRRFSAIRLDPLAIHGRSSASPVRWNDRVFPPSQAWRVGRRMFAALSRALSSRWNSKAHP
jgi:hypothetical protein